MEQKKKNDGHDYYRLLCESSSLAIISTDLEGKIISWNRAAEVIFGAAAPEMVGRHIEVIVPQERRSLLRKTIKRVVNKKQSSEFEVAHAQNRREPITLEAVIAPIFDEQKNILALAAWIHDITHRKNLQHSLAQAEKMASLVTLASGVAHHFNNIISGAATIADYAIKTGDDQAAQRALHMTIEAASRISQITSSLLTFAKKDWREFDLSDITEVILTFSNMVEKSLSKKNIQLELHLQPVPIHEVPASQMLKVLGNLLDNAESAMPEGGTVCISLQREGAETVLRFSDTGCGIAAENLPHIFDPFFTTQGISAGGNKPSSGLGLSVVQGIIEEIGGSIQVSSKVGKGTCLTMRFPDKEVSSEHDR